MKQFLLRFFTWWNGATLNTLFYTRRNGELVGHDEFGNAYYRTRGGKIDPALGFERRWVIYNGVSEASMTPPGWNGWLHHTVDTPPLAGGLPRPRMGTAASRQSDGNAGGHSPEGLDVASGPAAGHGRRLSGLDARRLTGAPSFRPALRATRRLPGSARSSKRRARTNP